MDTEAEAIAELAVHAQREPRIITAPDNATYLLAPHGYGVQNITPPHRRAVFLPDQIEQTLAVQNADSLIVYVERYKSDESMLFADIRTDRIMAVLDYHDPVTGGHAHTAHRAQLDLMRSNEWEIWTRRAASGLMEQLEFARFVEENGADIIAPVAAELLESVRDLQVHRRVNFMRAVRTATDNVCFEYSDTTDLRTKTGGIEVPNRIMLKLPVYFGEGEVELFAFLRWKFDDGKLSLGFALHRAEHVRQAVFKQVVERVGNATECPVVFGVLA